MEGAMQAKTTLQAPQTFEELTRQVHDRYDRLSRSYQQVARFLIQNPNEIAILSVTMIAERCGVHASSLVRFAQAFGYSGFKELQTIFQSRLATAASGFEARVGSLRDELALHSGAGAHGLLTDLVVRDIASLRVLLDDATESDLSAAVEIMAKAETIYLVGQLRSEPIAVFLRYVLTMLRRRVTMLDASGGLASEMARVIGPGDALLAVSFRFYAKEVVAICETAHGSGAPVIGITDSTLSPLAKTARVLFTAPEDEYTFSRSLAAPMCLAQALMTALAARLEEGEEPPRIPVATEPKK